MRVDWLTATSVSTRVSPTGAVVAFKRRALAGSTMICQRALLVMSPLKYSSVRRMRNVLATPWPVAYQACIRPLNLMEAIWGTTDFSWGAVAVPIAFFSRTSGAGGGRTGAGVLEVAGVRRVSS